MGSQLRLCPQTNFLQHEPGAAGTQQRVLHNIAVDCVQAAPVRRTLFADRINSEHAEGADLQHYAGHMTLRDMVRTSPMAAKCMS